MRMTRTVEIAAQRASIIYCVESIDNAPDMVRICPWQAKEWSLPWSRLEAATIEPEKEFERVELFFPAHQVIAVGHKLSSIMEDIRNGHVRCLRNLPESFAASLEAGEPFITVLEVRLLAGPENRTVDVPF